MRSIWQVVWRELSIIAHRPILWIATIGVPLFSVFFTTTIFGSGAIEEIPIGVVDKDFSASSRAIIRTIDSSPALHITHHFTSSTEALAAIRARAIYGYVVLPSQLESDMTQGIPTTIPYYFHYAFMSVGAQVESTLRTILTTASLMPTVITAREMGASEKQIEAFVEPLDSDTHPLGNPSLNYQTYLAEPFFFIMFQIIILLTTVYVLGSERNGGRDWLQTADGNILAAILGKLTPYTLAFIASGMAAIFIMYSTAHLVPQGVLWGLIGAMVALVIASISLALFIYSLFLSLGLTMSIVSMLGSIGATLSGVTFPIGSMYPIFRDVALALPIRHFTLIVQNLLYTKGGYEVVWWHAVALVAFCLLPLLTIPRLHKAIISNHYGNEA